MILGLGVDVVEVSRIARSLKNPRFAERILTKDERERRLTPQYVAGRWAAKEAVAKAWGGRLTWMDVEILPNADGRPVAAVRPPHPSGRSVRVSVSISHEKGHAVAVAVVEPVEPSGFKV